MLPFGGGVRCFTIWRGGKVCYHLAGGGVRCVTIGRGWVRCVTIRRGGGVPKTSAMVASRADPIDRLSSSYITPAGMSSPEELLPSMAPKGRCRDALGAK